MRTKKQPVKAKTTKASSKKPVTARRLSATTKTSLRRHRTPVTPIVFTKTRIRMGAVVTSASGKENPVVVHKMRIALLAIAAFLTLSATGGVSASTDGTLLETSHTNESQTVASDALFTPPSYLSNDLKEWTPMPGDIFEVNVETNMGRLVHENGEAVQFEVVTGVRRVVSYIGLRYFAATPAQNWIVRTTEIKRDRWTFGKSGRFIRLFKVNADGTEESTSYGIHPFLNEDAMFKVPGRYGSMGCIILRESLEDLIQKTIETNGGSMSVRTFPDMPKDA